MKESAANPHQTQKALMPAHSNIYQVKNFSPPVRGKFLSWPPWFLPPVAMLLCDPLSLSVGKTLRICQNLRDFVNVIKVPHQVTLSNQKKTILGCPELIREPFKRTSSRVQR